MAGGAPVPSADPHVMAVLDSVTAATWQYIVLPYLRIAVPIAAALWLLVLFLWIRNKKNKK